MNEQQSKQSFRFVSRTLRFQFLVIIAILLIMPILLISYDLFFASRSDEAMLAEREQKLGSLVEHLIIPEMKNLMQATTGDTNFNSLDPQQRVSYLKSAFDRAAEPLVPSNPGVRFGLYIPETDQIFVQGFLHNYRKLSPAEQRERERRIMNEANSGIINVAAGGQPLARLTSSLNDPTYEYLAPLYSGGKLVAVVWADQGVHPAFTQSRFFRTISRYLAMFALILSALGVLVIIHNLTSAVSKIKEGLSVMEQDLHHPIPELPGEAGQIAQAINKMASSLSEKEKLEEELRRSERLAALGRLVTGVAHELRNPIGVIKTTVQLMKSEFQEVDGAKEHIKVIEEQINRQNMVIQELLDFGRPSKHVVQSASINSLLDKVLTFTTPLLRQHNIALVREFDNHLPSTEMDAERIKQVFVNLILNAVQAMPGGGTLTIRTFSDDHWVCAEFSDTGDGISPADINSIFDPFYTTKEKGTGLGLSISHQIVRAHGGHIKVESAEHQGTTFTVQLPLTEETWDLYS